MSRIWIVAALLMTAPVTALGASAEAGEESVADYVMHHVVDSNAWEIEVPLSYEHISIPLPEIFVPFTAGACTPVEDPAHPGQLVRPGLGNGCLDLSITKHTVIMWVSALVLILVMMLLPNRNKNKLVPHGTAQNVIEMLVLFVRDELAVKNIGKEWGAKYTPYLITLFFFILFMNLMGLLPWSATATSNLAVTAGLAICTFIVTQFAAIRAAGLKAYLAHLTGGVHPALWVVMVPVEVLGLFTKPFALTVRLFANMLAGHIVIFFLLGLIFILKSVVVAAVSVPFAMAMYFLELFVSAVQAYIFTMLSALFIGMGVATAHHDHDHEPHAGHGDHAEGQGEHGHAAAH